MHCNLLKLLSFFMSPQWFVHMIAIQSMYFFHLNVADLLDSYLAVQYSVYQFRLTPYEVAGQGLQWQSVASSHCIAQLIYSHTVIFFSYISPLVRNSALVGGTRIALSYFIKCLLIPSVNFLSLLYFILCFFLFLSISFKLNYRIILLFFLKQSNYNAHFILIFFRNKYQCDITCCRVNNLFVNHLIS